MKKGAQQGILGEVTSMRLILLAALVLAALPATARGATVPPFQIPLNGAVIVSPPTGDLAGYRIVVAPTGDATAVDGAGSAQRALPPALVKSLFVDLEAAMPLSKLPPTACVTSFKAPTPLLVYYHGETSPDLTCASDAKLAALYSDMQAVARALYVANYRSRAISHYSGNSQPADSSVPAAAPAPAPLPAAPRPMPGY